METQTRAQAKGYVVTVLFGLPALAFSKFYAVHIPAKVIKRGRSKQSNWKEVEIRQ